MSGRSPVPGSGRSPKGGAAKASPAKPSVPNAIADKLDEARALIERGWTQGCMAQDSMGRLVRCKSPEAARFCIYGAIVGVSQDKEQVRLSVEYLRRATRINKIGLTVWNDAKDRRQPQVIDAFKRAAEIARAEAQ